MRPNKEGIWEWFEKDGTKRLVAVCNVSLEVGGTYLRVYWWGGYYNVNDEIPCPDVPADPFCKMEWPDKWGNFVGEPGSIPSSDLYLGPTLEQLETIYKQ